MSVEAKDCLDQLAAPFSDGLTKDISYRPIIVWAMNDTLSEDESRRQLQSFQACGYGGVMIMPWGGLPYDFMDEGWLEQVGNILTCAQQLGLDIWIWDDWCFGSGTAAGNVTREQQYRAKMLSIAVDVILEAGESIKVTLPPRTLAGAVFPIDKFGNPVGAVEAVNAKPGSTVTAGGEVRQRLVVVCWKYTSGMQNTTRSHGRFLDAQIPEEVCDIYINEDADVWSVDMLKPAATRQYLALIHEVYHQRFAGHFGKTLKGFFYDEPKASSNWPWTDDFLERFEKIKGYDLSEHLVLMLFDFRMEDVSFNAKLRPEAVRKVLADYRDVWTTLLAESFYGQVDKWCRTHGVIATGHPMGDNGFAWSEIGGASGTYFKNMAYSDMPGVDIIWGNIQAGSFNDAPRLAGSRAAVLGHKRAMSESFGVFGHGVYPDQMRYVMEHQLIRGVNTFFNKLTNYNRQKSFYFHPPDLSDYNPIIKHYGRVIHDRIDIEARMMNGGEAPEMMAIYVPLLNYYRQNDAIVMQIETLAEKLVYNQVEFDYLVDRDILELQVRDGRCRTRSGRKYGCIIVPDGADVEAEIAQQFGALTGAGGSVVACAGEGSAAPAFARGVANLDTVIDEYRRGDQLIEFLSRDVPIAMRRRIGSDGTCVYLALNESLERAAMKLRLRPGVRLLQVDLGSGEVFALAGPGESIEVELAPTESKLLIADNHNKIPTSKRAPLDQGAAIPLKDWQIQLPTGETVHAGEQMPSWDELGQGNYNGFMRYSTEFNWDQGGSAAVVSLGSVCYAATVLLDGQKVSDCVFTPFSVRLDGLTKGKHRLEIDVLNTQASTVCGTPERLESLERSGAFKGTYAPLYLKMDMKKIRSGLFGVVEIIPYQ